MVVCGDDALASRLAIELREIYGQSVVVVVPPAQSTERIPAPLTARGDGRAAALRERMAVVMTWAAGSQAQPGASDTQYQGGIAALEASVANDAVLTQAGIERAAALALVYDDDETNIRAALIARRRNPHLRLVIRLYNRKLGQHLEELLDQSAILAAPGLDPAELDASTTVLSDADTTRHGLAELLGHPAPQGSHPRPVIEQWVLCDDHTGAVSSWPVLPTSLPIPRHSVVRRTPLDVKRHRRVGVAADLGFAAHPAVTRQ
ncbi:hypothetical protein DKG71_34175 [Streptomyces sp. NEAU-S7GS2]|nr:hypothetical protein DKG71_34175 [Streptomyces sp. NEAU-S7GS2]